MGLRTKMTRRAGRVSVKGEHEHLRDRQKALIEKQSVDACTCVRAGEGGNKHGLD